MRMQDQSFLLGERGFASNTEEAIMHGTMNVPIGMGRGLIRGLGFTGRIRGPQTIGQGIGYGMMWPAARAARIAAMPVARAGVGAAGLGLGAAAGVAGFGAGMAVSGARMAMRFAGVGIGVGAGAYSAARSVLTPAGMIWAGAGLGTAAIVGGSLLRAELASWQPVDQRNPVASRFQNSAFGLPQALSDLARPY